MNLETTIAVCRVILLLKKKHLKTEDWETLAIDSVKQEWGQDAKIEFFEDHCVIKNTRTGNKKIISDEN